MSDAVSPESPLIQLARRVGLTLSYQDAFGRPVQVPDATLRAALAALGHKAETEADCLRSLEADRNRQGQTMLEPTQLVYLDQADMASVTLLVAETAKGPGRWILTYEQRSAEDPPVVRDGTFDLEALRPVRDPDEADEPTDAKTPPLGRVTPPPPDGMLAVTLPLPVALVMGYHTLELRLADGTVHRCTVIFTPSRAWMPPVLAPRSARSFGLAVQLYGLKGRQDWGIGDFAALREAVDAVASEGGGAVGINPLHALFPTRPDHRSPYSPNSRQFLNPLYIALHNVPEYPSCQAAQDAAIGAAVSSLSTLESGDGEGDGELVDYAAVGAVAWPTLEALYQTFLEAQAAGPTHRSKAFAAFCAEQGETLQAFALFEVLSEHFKAKGIWIWQDWPKAYQDPDSATVRKFAKTKANAERIAFHCWLQFEADRQLGKVQERAVSHGMPIGVYRDLAVGADPTGFDAWRMRDGLLPGFGVGCPPDIWNALGQNWGFPPFNPDALLADGLRPFAEMIRANMRHAGALRMDHVLGLMRLFVIPVGHSPAEGVYINFPLDAFLAVLAVESFRAKCIVVGEDLGTVPDGIRARMAEAGVLSYRLFFFEREDDESLIPQEDWPRLAAVAATTHDLPTLAGYWSGTDLKWKVDLNLFPSEAMRQAEGMRRHDDRPRIRAELAAEGLSLELPPESDTPPEDLAPAIYQWLAKTPSLLEMVQIEDVLDCREQANVPGTLDEHPNWCRRMPVAVSEWRTDGRLAKVCAAIRAERSEIRLDP